MCEKDVTNYSLIQRACALSDQQAWDEIYKTYSRFIFHLIHKSNVDYSSRDDVHQKVMIGLMQGIERYDSAKGRFRSWLAQIVRNTIANHYRKEFTLKNQMLVFTDDTEALPMAQEAEVDQRIEEEWESYLMERAIELSEQSFKGHALEVFKRKLRGQETAEIAAELNISANSVYTLFQRAKGHVGEQVKLLVKEYER